MIQTRVLEERLPYTGIELRPHFLLTRWGLKGDAVATFRGPAHVQTEHLVDWEDRLAQDRIEAREMVHVLGEFFGWTLREGVLAQRLLMATGGEVLGSLMRGRRTWVRQGDDLFVADRKLSVSIVTASPVSVLLHAAVNVDPTGAPVPAIGLAELEVDPDDFSQKWIARFSEELGDLAWACAKVRPVV